MSLIFIPLVVPVTVTKPINQKPNFSKPSLTPSKNHSLYILKHIPCSSIIETIQLKSKIHTLHEIDS